MDRLAYHNTDKSGWQRGPWDNEPDKVQWRDEATGLPCLIVRATLGHLCGYVGVPPGHPWHGVEADAVRVGDEWPNVHGGLTFAEGCQGGDPARSVCHVPDEGEPDDVWWLGFDCAHLGDLTCLDTPAAYRFESPAGDIYRDLAYVTAETGRLAAQAKAAIS
jgi:hypothetical protein